MVNRFEEKTKQAPNEEKKQARKKIPDFMNF